MGWDAIIVGEVTFPRGAVATWKTTPARVLARDWPQLIDQAVDSSMYDDEPSVGVVLDDALQQDHWFGTLAVDDAGLRIAYSVDNSNWWMVAERVVRLLCGAAGVGASGRVLFCDAGDAIALGAFTGALITLGAGKLACDDKQGEPLTAADRLRVDTVVEAVLAKGKAARAAAAPAATAPKATAPTKAKAKAKAKAKGKAQPKRKPARTSKK